MTATLASALVAAQAEMPAVQPDSVNPHFGSRFVSLGHLIAKTKPVLTKHGLAIVQEPASIDGQPALTTTLLHAESGEQKSSTAPLILQKQDMQGLGGALTYMRRYAWAAVLGISDEEDDDGNQASTPAAQTPAAAQRAQETQPTASRNSATISEAQAKRLFAIARDKDVSQERVKELIKEIAGVESSADIPKAAYEALCNAVEAEGLPF